MTHSHLSLFDLITDSALVIIERLARTYGEANSDGELENFANSCRAELQHRAAERRETESDELLK
jgi:hypothetical protein